MPHRLSCRNCGSPLSVADDAETVACEHCGTRLAVERGGGAWFTRRVEQVRERTDRLAEDVAEARRRKDAGDAARAVRRARAAREAHEREWDRAKRSYGIPYDSDTGVSWREPRGSDLLGTFLFPAAFLLLLSVVGWVGHRELVPARYRWLSCLGLVLIGLLDLAAIWLTMRYHPKFKADVAVKARKFRRARARYECRCAELRAERPDSSPDRAEEAR